MLCIIHFFIILFSETSLPLSSIFLSSVLLRVCQSHANYFVFWNIQLVKEKKKEFEIEAI